MSTARNGDVEIYYEEFGDPGAPTLLLVNGLGSQCLNYDVAWCQLFCEEGFHVVRYDNRDVGLSTKLDGIDYALTDMANDAIAVLDAMGVDKAHVMGCSMGGMIVQRLALDHPDRLLSLTSVMSRTGEPGYGDSSEEALAFLLAPPAPSRAAYIDRQVAALHVYGSKPEWLDDDAIRTRAAAAYDRCFCPEGIGRQMKAVTHDGSRSPSWPTWTSPPSSSTAAGTRSSTRAVGAVRPRSFQARATWRSTVWVTTTPHRSGRSGWLSGRSSPTPRCGPDQGGASRSPWDASSPVRCFHSDAFAEMAAVSKRPAK